MQWQVVVVEWAPFLPMTRSGSQESSLDAVEGGDGRFIYLPEIKPQVSRLQPIHTHQGLVLLPRRLPEKVSKVHPTSYDGPEGEQNYKSTLSLASALDRGRVFNATSRLLYPRGWPRTHSIDLLGPRAGLDGCVTSHPRTGFDPWTIQQVAWNCGCK
jgi:hypothetical protein